MRGWIYLFAFVLLGSFVLGRTAQAQDIQIPYEEELHIEEVQRTMDELLGQDSFSFREYIYQSLQSESKFSIQDLLNKMMNVIKAQMETDKNRLIQFVGIGILAAVFTNFARVFRNRQVSEMGFYVTYLMMFSISCASFYKITEIAAHTLENIIEFMRALIPAYYMAITFSAGVGSSGFFYQVTLILIQVVEVLIMKGIFPLIRIFFVLSLINNLSQEDLLSKAIELLDTIIRWTLKSLLGLITGYNIIQGLIAPIADTFKNRMTMKLVNVLPGVGNILGSAAETIFGAGIVLKNAMGAAGICVLILLLAVPSLRIGFYSLLYKGASALIQPISDKRIVECLNGTAKAAGLLLYATFAAGVLFLLTILVVMATTNGRLG
ncbi:MAG: stage III sporulation protein AE [Acetivibrio sp.]